MNVGETGRMWDIREQLPKMFCPTPARPAPWANFSDLPLDTAALCFVYSPEPPHPSFPRTQPMMNSSLSVLRTPVLPSSAAVTPLLYPPYLIYYLFLLVCFCRTPPQCYHHPTLRHPGASPSLCVACTPSEREDYTSCSCSV